MDLKYDGPTDISNILCLKKALLSIDQWLNTSRPKKVSASNNAPSSKNDRKCQFFSVFRREHTDVQELRKWKIFCNHCYSTD